ncbi:hypothetical protein MMC11_005899 [Xylographa trunciseda]|nr:hypothetical protein [Xylographa trunciseda]
MDYSSRGVTQVRRLNLPHQGFTNQDSKEPWGIRTPNGLIWAHDLDDLYDVRSSKNGPVPVYWSVSMIQEFELASRNIPGASKTNRQWEHGASWKLSPRKPWPLLRFPEKVQRRKSIGASDEKLDYCHNLRRTPSSLKTLRSGEDYYVTSLNEKPRKASYFCGHCEDPTLRTPISCVKRHCDVHCKCQNRWTLLRKSKSLPDICSVGDSDDFTVEESPIRQKTMESIDTERIPYGPETTKKRKLSPKLEEFIPNDFLPDILLVDDDNDCATGKQGLRGMTESVKDKIGKEKSQRRYYRVLPVASQKGYPPEHKLRTAYLDLSGTNLCGVGNHSSVYRASFLPPPPLTTNFRSLKGRVTVIAKTAFPSKQHLAHLDNEAEVLNKLSMKARRHMQQEWCGFNVLPGLNKPVPVGPVVPKFYGYYKPQKQKGSSDNLSPILLIEDCGMPVKQDNLSQENKEEIYSLFLRLHQAYFVQNSSYVRNILIQPGPLTRPPMDRSLTTPSFRIIDFGRADDRTMAAGVSEDAWKVVLQSVFARRCARNEMHVREDIGLEIE